MLLADVVATSGRVAATRSRSAKIEALADLFRRVPPADIETVVAYTTGEPRQGRIGVGWATLGSALSAVDHAAASTLTVADVDAELTFLAGLEGSGSAGRRHDAVRSLAERATSPEAVFLRHLLTGELRQGALAGVVTDAVAKAAGIPAAAVRRASMLAGDLPQVAAIALAGGDVTAVSLEVGRPVLPMLASTSATVAAAIADLGLASVEWKLDGARIQAHRRGDDIRLFTRNQNDVTSRLPGVVAVVAGLPVDEVVLDGEVLGVGSDERPDRFQDTMSRFGRRAGDDARLGVAFFDVLRVDGADLLDEPLTARQVSLERVAGPWRITSILTDDPDQAQRFSDGALAAGHEGVMVKAASSTYDAGRRGQAWRKVKPVRTFDLVILAVERGNGRRRGWLSNLHLGARDPDGGFVMVGKTFKGLTDDMLRWQTRRLGELAVDDDGYTVSVRPELVVEIALDGVQSSTRYAGGVALRFARVRRYREDKSPADADTIDSVRALLLPPR